MNSTLSEQIFPLSIKELLIMTYQIKISEEAELDLEEAYQWYEKQVNNWDQNLLEWLIIN
jgi:hypothetical protein